MDSDTRGAELAEARRQFLAKCGRFAIATPPAISLLLAASKANYAVATSGGGGGGGGTNGGINLSSVNTSSPVGTTSSHNCGNTFDALFNNDKCFR